MSVYPRSNPRRREVAAWIRRLARAGYFAKGSVYVILGVLTGRAALLGQVQPQGTRNTIQMIGTDLFGRVALGLLALGLAGYAAWQLVRAVLNPEEYGNLKGMIKRGGLTVSGFAFLGLAYFCAVTAILAHPIGSSRGEDDWTARVMAWPLGAWLVAAFGLIAAGVAVNDCYVAYTAAFMKRITVPGDHGAGRWLKRAGQFGIAARGVVLLIVASFFVDAAWERRPSAAGGLGEALRLLENAPLGPLVLLVVAAGLAAFGVYELLRSRYRRIPAQRAVDKAAG